MPTCDTLERFIATVERNDHIGALEAFYAPNASMQENRSVSRIGRDLHVANERRVLGRAKTVSSTCVRPVPVHGDVVVIRWIFQFEWIDGGVSGMEELAWQRWEGERVVEETFYYDPTQLAPLRPQG